MNIFNKTTWESLKRNRSRTIVTLIGIILSAAMITAVAAFIASLQHYLLQTAIVRNGDWQVAFTQIDADTAREIDSDRRVEYGIPMENIGYALLEGGENPSKPYLFITGFAPGITLPVTITEGRMPRNTREILISEHIETNGGVKYVLGDTLTLAVGDRIQGGKILGQEDWYQRGITEDNPEENADMAERFQPRIEKTYTVVGICARPIFEHYSAPGYTIITAMMDPGTSSLFPYVNQTASLDLYIRLKSPARVYDFTEAHAGTLNYKYNQDYLRYAGISDDDNFNTVLYSLGGILIALIMIGSVLLIYNAFAISVSERKRQFGLLSSVGATRKQLRQTVLFEGLCLGCLGIPLGILAGIVGIGLTLKVVNRIMPELSNSGVSLTLFVSIGAVAVATLVGIVTILISAFIPAFQAAGTSAMDSIRQSRDIKVKAKAVKTSRLTGHLFGLEGMLAGKHFKRDKKRYRSTIISLFVSVVLFISASAFGFYLKQGTEISIRNFGYDLSFSPYNLAMKDTEILQLYNKLRSVGNVTDSAWMQNIWAEARIAKDMLNERYVESTGRTAPDDSSMRDVWISVSLIDDETWTRYLKDLGVPANAYTGDDAKLIAMGKVQEYDQTARRYISFDVLPIGQEISLQIFRMSEGNHNDTDNNNDNQPTVTRALTLTCVDKMPALISRTRHNGITIIAPLSLKEQFMPFFEENSSNSTDMMFLSNNPAQSAAQMKTILSEAGIGTDGRLINMAEIVEQNRNLLLVINIFVYGFIVLISLIAIANVFNTISTGINLRRRGFAMLRSVGMTRRSFNRMMVFECVIYGVRALLYGLPTAAVVTYFIWRAVDTGAEVPFTLPWSSIAISVISVFLVVFVTMMYAIRKVNKENILEALRME